MPFFVRNPLDDTRVICDPCGTKRWGDPIKENVDSFNARCADPDDWCWWPRWSMRRTPCSDCGGDVDTEPTTGWEQPVSTT